MTLFDGGHAWRVAFVMTLLGAACSASVEVRSTVADAALPGIDAGASVDGEPISENDAATAMAVDAGPPVDTSVCGDGVISGNETCDDHNTHAGDGCDASCTVEDGWFCTGAPSSCHTTCGDGIVAGTEECDDGGNDDGDGCDSLCFVEHGYICTGSPSDCATTCGDGVIGGAETCDDLNTRDGDGCDDSCNVESGYVCDGEPSICTMS